MSFEAATRVEGRVGEGQDRVALIDRGVLVAVVADGAGGTSGGAEAAQTLVDRVRQASEEGRELNKRGLRQLLLEISLELEDRGQTTAVVVVIGREELIGASIGDSGAWLVERGSWIELTAGQPRKPLVGGGFAEPFTFERAIVDAELLLATDGVLKYANGEAVRALLRNEALSAEACCAAVIDAARLPSGELQDDAGAVLVRLRPEARLVNELRQWLSVAGDASRELRWALERFLFDVFPDSPLATGTDGVDAAVIEDSREEALLISGSIWAMTPMKLYPFRARLRLGRDRIEDYEVQLGEDDAQLVAVKTAQPR